MKNFRYALLSLLLPILLVACAQQDEAAPAATTPAPVEQPAPASADADADAPADAQADASAEAQAGAAQDPAPEQAEAATQAPAPQPPQGPPPVAGTHYVEIQGGQPYLPLNGQIEVVEVFGYTCPACANFEPLISAWKQRQPADVRVTQLAAPFGGFWMPYAKAYYAAESLDLLDRTHQPMFEAVHLQRSLPVQGASTEAIAAFYASHGADAKQFANTMESFAVSGKLRRAEQFIGRSGVDSTPTMIVNGKYRVVSGQQYEDVLRIVDHLVARERAAGE